MLIAATMKAAPLFCFQFLEFFFFFLFWGSEGQRTRSNLVLGELTTPLGKDVLTISCLCCFCIAFTCRVELCWFDLFMIYLRVWLFGSDKTKNCLDVFMQFLFTNAKLGQEHLNF